MSDLISREEVLDEINRIGNGAFTEYAYYSNLFDFVCELPSDEPERKPGHWEWNQRTGEYECSECGCNPIYEGITPDESEIDKYRFCRWCGTPMEVDG
jgi:hypothetical protein